MPLCSFSLSLSIYEKKLCIQNILGTYPSCEVWYTCDFQWRLIYFIFFFSNWHIATKPSFMWLLPSSVSYLRGLLFKWTFIVMCALRGSCCPHVILNDFNGNLFFLSWNLSLSPVEKLVILNMSCYCLTFRVYLIFPKEGGEGLWP